MNPRMVKDTVDTIRPVHMNRCSFTLYERDRYQEAVVRGEFFLNTEIKPVPFQN